MGFILFGLTLATLVARGASQLVSRDIREIVMVKH